MYRISTEGQLHYHESLRKTLTPQPGREGRCLHSRPWSDFDSFHRRNVVTSVIAGLPVRRVQIQANRRPPKTREINYNPCGSEDLWQIR
jgi:hypothetical protein